MLEFLGYRFSFGARDFEERVAAAAVKLGLVAVERPRRRTRSATSSSSQQTGASQTPRSSLGSYLVRHWERLALLDGESLVYWLRKLVFRGAYLDHRVKEGLLEVAWDDESARVRLRRAERRPRAAGARPHALLAHAPVPGRLTRRHALRRRSRRLQAPAAAERRGSERREQDQSARYSCRRLRPRQRTPSGICPRRRRGLRAARIRWRIRAREHDQSGGDARRSRAPAPAPAARSGSRARRRAAR